MALTQILMIDGYGNRKVLSLHFRQQQFSIIGSQQGCCLADTGSPDVLFYRLAGSGNIYLSQFIGSIKFEFKSISFCLELLDNWFLCLDINSTDLADAFRPQTNMVFTKQLLDILISIYRCLMDQSDTQIQHLWGILNN